MIEPTEIIGDCHLYHGDTMEIIPQLVEQDVLADLLVCDPPYELSSGGVSKGGLHERFGGGGVYENTGNFFEGDIPHWQEFMPLFYLLLQERAHCYVMAEARNQFDMQLSARDAGFYRHNLLVWNKRTGTPNRWYMKTVEFTGLFSKGKAFRINDCGSSAMADVPQIDQTEHPTEKPVDLMAHYIKNSSKRGQCVADPFMGTGTTGIAAVKTGRKFIGIERDRRWFDVACERMDKEYRHLQTDLFYL